MSFFEVLRLQSLSTVSLKTQATLYITPAFSQNVVMSIETNAKNTYIQKTSWKWLNAQDIFYLLLEVDLTGLTRIMVYSQLALHIIE